jgi:hypothetical protein
MKIPEKVDIQVVMRLFADAERINWDDMNGSIRSRQYAKWVSDPEVGGLLTRYMDEAQARLWIKDGPMKEWVRSRSGVGKYAGLVPTKSSTPAAIVVEVMSGDWSVVDGSIRTKPLRVVVVNSGEQQVVTWGPERDVKHLVWAALNAAANGDDRVWTICVVDSFTKPVPSNVRKGHCLIAQRCGLRLVHVTV